MSEQKEYILNTFEKMVINASQCGDYLVMGTCFFQGRDLNSKLDQNIAFEALKKLQIRHEILRSYLKVSESSMYFVPHDFDVSDKIIFEWLDLSHEEVDREKLMSETGKFNSILFSHGNKELLWRAQIIEYKKDNQFKYVLNFVFFGIADGMFSSSILVELVNIINSLESRQEVDLTRVEITENMNILCQERGLWKDSHAEMVRKMNQRDLAKFNMSNGLKDNESGFQLDMFYLDNGTSSKIMSVSKQNKVRLTSYFYAAAFYALKKLYDENKLVFPDRVTCELPVCLRFRYEPKLDFNQSRLHTTMVLFSTEKENFGEFKNFWEDSRYLQGLIVENTSTETGTLFSLSHSEDLEEFNKVFQNCKNLDEALEILSQGVMSDLALSNLGAYVNDNVKEIGGVYTIDEMFCTDPVNSKPSISCGLIIHLIFWKGKIMIDLGANKYTIGSKYFKRYKQHLLDVINETLA
ncbi:unnamed protein product [Brachionus calyciflorus]|uniref:Condensation domain-containing protein n=1 Tax=Brachionus calyciflorus TaxID=104777 RepID=A0A813Z4M1_9BILA|nr:unnamed protein product [Brachionus calyciflorus]